MIGLIAFDSLLYSSRIALRKNYVFKHITPVGHMLFATICSLLFLFIWYLIDPKYILKDKDIAGLKKIAVWFFVLQLASFLNYYLFLTLLDKNDISYLIPLNQLFVILFSSIIGVLFLNETITAIKLIGIILGCISIYMINC